MLHLYETEMLVTVRVEANNVREAREKTLAIAKTIVGVLPVGASALQGGDALSSTVRS